MDNDQYSLEYAVLELQPGASDEDIHSAFRRLAKLYHPDQDSSVDAQVKYQEVRIAYDVLRTKSKLASMPLPGQYWRTGQEQFSWHNEASRHTSPSGGASSTSSSQQYGMGGTTGWQMQNDGKSASTEEDPFFYSSSSNWQKKLPQQPPKKKLKPFSLSTLPGIILDSFNEALSVLLLVRITFTTGLLWWICFPISPFFALVTISFTFLGSAIFRYYNPCPPADMGIYFRASLYYAFGTSAAAMIYSMTLGLSSEGFSGMKLISQVLTFLLATVLLWIGASFPTDGRRK